MHIEYLEEFIELADSLSYSKTAQKLHIAQSALSRHIAQLEESLGAPLFARTTRSVALTETGKLFCGLARPIVHAYHDALEDVARSLSEECAVLRIAFPYSFADRYLQPELARFAKDHPNARIELVPIQPQHGEQMLLEGTCDVTFDIIYPFVAPNPHFVGRIVGIERFCICLPSAHRLARKKQLAPADLAKCTFIKSADYPRYNEFIDRFLEMSQVETKGEITANSLELIYSTALRHNAVEIRIATTGMQEREGISYVPLDSDLTAKIRLVRLDSCENPLARQFVQGSAD